MTVFKRTGLAVAALTLCAGLQAAESSHYVLEKAVQVSRHGVRSPTDTDKLVKATGRDWTPWLVQDGELTGHGYLAASQMGTWQAAYYRNAGLLADGCPQPGSVVAVASPKQRTRSTAAALLDGMFPGCGEKARARSKPDPLFQTDEMPFAKLDPAIAKAQILQALGGTLQAAQERLRPDLERLKDAVCETGKACPFFDTPWALKEGDGGRFKIKGLDKASSMAETIRLQYSEGMPLADVAFGHARDAAQVSALGRLHRAKYDFINDTAYIASRGGSQLMNQIVLALEQGTALEKNDPLGNPPPARLLMLVAHDTNISHLRTMLGFTWALGEYQPGNIPPTGTLAFERYRDSQTGERFVRTRFITQGMDQIRALQPLDVAHPPLQTDFDQPGCQHTAVGTLCPIAQFVERTGHTIDRSALTAYRYP
ncbi:histidine-type phosphatase [Pseudomonas sp. AN3A02]|jgi:4-phytase/acid phosphatase|uniref:histidine-type phosphatase n=1 Tax=Pseudomonas sp. AN3A02 TaxID=2719587 RepID=UPI0014308BE8|nr:histidine-type phosphatase [Pseudomonas sp. AN3A02]NIL17019.1 histidine-type phosphatase [Pseudomonas sp. AN3A02]